MKMRFFVLILLFGFQFVMSQNMTFYHYGLDDGLSQQTIRCILKDSKGFLWLGTQDGLNKFDGNSFTVFKHKNRDSLSISGNYINRLLENTDGNIWIALNNSGVCYYNSNTNTFTQTKIDKGNCTGLSKDKNGNVYAVFLDRSPVVFNKVKTTYSHQDFKFKKTKITSNAVINDKLYFGTGLGELLVADNLNSLNLTPVSLKQKLGIINEIEYYNGLIWLGTSKGLYTFNQTYNSLNYINLKKYNTTLSENLFIESIRFKDNTIYVGTDNGLFILKNYKPLKDSFDDITIFIGDKNTTNSITSNRVYDIWVDDDLLWIGTNNLDVASLVPPPFKTINTKSKIKINNNHVYSLFKTDDYTFVGTRNGLNCFDNKGKRTLITRENTNNKLAYNVIRAMILDSNNNLWLATTKGVSVLSLNNFNPENPQLKSTYYNESNLNSLSSNKTRGVFKDHKNTIWIATYGGGINRFTGNVATNNFSFKRYKTNENNSISSDYTFSIEQDKYYNYWITSENGLNKLHFNGDDYKEPKFTVYQYDKNNPTSIQSNTTLHTHVDVNGLIWIATQNGLHKLNPTTEEFIQYDETNGLTNNYVYNILEDKQHNLWLSTNDGVFRFNKNIEHFSHYTTSDGVQSSEFNLGAYFYDEDKNTLYLGGVNGYNLFSPKDLENIDNEGNLLFTTLKIKDKIANPITHPKNLDKSISETASITLYHNDFPVTLSFADLDLNPNKNYQFKYNLNDNEWNSLQQKREISLVDLPKGNHTLQIQGLSRQKTWSKEPISLSIKVIPPWYKSNLAYLLYFVTFLGIGYAMYRLSLQRQLAKQESVRLRDLDSLKTKFITNITHEFRTPLTIILGYVNNLKESFSKTDKNYTSLKSIERSGNTLLTLVNDMMDLAKLEQGKLTLNYMQSDFVTYCKYIVESFTSYADTKNIALEFSLKAESLIMDFDQEKMRQIVSNLLSNAIKYSNQNSTVTVSLLRKGENVILTIKDDGVGISNEELPYIFDRFYQTNSSISKTSSSGIGLALTKELVELMKGKINVTSVLEKGTTFTISLPVKNTANLSSIEKPKKNQTFTIPLVTNNEKNKKPNTVLIVEDNPEITHFIGECLQANYNILFAKNGQEGFDAAEKEIPDIIITDVMMPVMNGNELTQKLQSTTTTSHIPIIMLTAKAVQEDRLQGLQSGADVYLTKPFQKEELQLRIKKLIEKRQRLQERYQLPKIFRTETSEKKQDKNLLFLDKVIQFIQKNIENPDYNAKALASDVCMSESQLYRKLKAITNKSTAVFIRSVRLEKAKELLTSTNLSVAEIAYSSGFNNPNWFSKAFKEEFGKSPSEFKL